MIGPMTSFMNRTTAYLIGPELIWILMFAFAGIFVAVNQPISSLGHWKVMFSNLFLPAIGVMLAFAPFFWTPGNPWWCLARIMLVSLLGVVGLVFFLSKAASYQDVRDVGIILGSVAFIAMGWTVLGFMGGIAGLFLISHWAYLPVLKWILILFALFMLFLVVWWRIT